MENKKLKKIIVLGPVYPYRGGNSLYVSYLYDSLKEHFDIKIFNYKLLYPGLLFPGTTQYDQSETLYKKAPSERLINSINPFNWFNVAQRIKSENADLVVFDWWHPFFGPCHFSISAFIRKKYKGKILFITENFISHEGNAVDKTLTRIGLKNADTFLALSDIVAKDLKYLSGSRKIYRSDLPVFECYNSGEPADFLKSREKLGISSSSKVLLFFGYVRKYKGLDLLIDALPLVKKEYPDTKLLIVGEFYDNPSVYTEKIKSLGLENDVVLINRFVPNEEVAQFYEASDVVVLPYRSATQSGILNVAYGFFKPAVVTNVGGLSEFVKNGETGIIVKPDSPEEIYKGISEIFKMTGKTDFRTNIELFVKSNKFLKLPELFSEIIGDSEK